MGIPDTYYAQEEVPLRLPPVSRMAGWLGAATSVALVGALAWWAVDLALRDARGVPVVRALEGPARVAPEDPGGFQAAHQGRSVNSIASENAVDLADRVLLAPEPAGVSDEDRPLAALDPASRDAVLRSAVGAALQAALGGGSGAPAPGPAGAPQTGSAEDAAGAGLPVQSLSPRPRQRPDLDLATRAAPDLSLPKPGAAPAQIDVAAIPPGTRLVQLGAFDTAEIAQQTWSRLSDQFDSYMVDKSRVIERAEVSEREFWRLRALGFASLADARNFCAVLLAEQADCIPVLTR